MVFDFQGQSSKSRIIGFKEKTNQDGIDLWHPSVSWWICLFDLIPTRSWVKEQVFPQLLFETLHKKSPYQHPKNLEKNSNANIFSQESWTKKSLSFYTDYTLSPMIMEVESTTRKKTTIGDTAHFPLNDDYGRKGILRWF